MKVGVIGTGSMGRNHCRILAEMGVLGGVFDLNSESADEIAARHHVERYASMDDLMRDMDAVSICTPTVTHQETALKAISAGLDLLVEKPFTGKVALAEEVCDAAEKEGVVLAAGMVERFNPVVREAKRRLDAGDFGDLITISSRRVSSFPQRIRDVGVILDLGVHDVDALSYICGSRAESVFASGGGFNGSEFEDHATVIMKMADGTEALVEVNWLTPMKVRNVYMTCSKLYAKLDYMAQMISTSSSRYVGQKDESSFESPWEFDYREMFLKKEEPLRLELQNFIDSCKGVDEVLVSGRDVVDDLKVCDCALRSLLEGRRIDVL